MDELTERDLSNIQLESNDSIVAFCHLRNEYRTFVLSRIEQACDLDSGQEIEDIWIYLGVPSLKPALKTFPTFTETRRTLTDEEAHRERNKDKAALYHCFKLTSLIELQRKKLRGQFDDQCFNCGSKLNLVHDHHIPQSLGGRLVPGNIVILCSLCNHRKLNQHPRVFYSLGQLLTLQPLLEEQVRMFDFVFNHTRWANHPKEYLLELGVSEVDIQRELAEAQHHVGITLSLDAIKKPNV